jgi:glyoxylase-like metal-dependent hydrolase (beta-lactamase superfamily II)
VQISEHVFLVGSEQFGLSHPMDCNCYLIDGGNELGLIDAGVGLGVDDILANIASAGFDPKQLRYVIITHSHMGHWGGARELRARTGAKVLAPVAALPQMTDVMKEPGVRNNLKFNRYPAGFEPKPCPPDGTFGDGDHVKIGNVELRMIVVEGHTPDSTCMLFEDAGKRGLFTGDVVFYGGMIGLLNMEGCSMDSYRRDIGKLADLQVDMLLPGHSVFILRNGQKHIKRAIFKLADFVMPDTFFETNEFSWDRDYLRLMTEDVSSRTSA